MATTEVPRRPRGPGVLHAAISLGFFALVTVIALTATQPPPPSVAEFAPQAIERIDEAPDEQASGVEGAGGRGGGPAGSSEGPVDARGEQDRQVVNVPRVRRCVGDPPRQIEDPQSPPCVPYWDGDNGGETSKGVTRDEVRIATPNRRPGHAVYERFFNSRFEFYGRRIRLVDTAGPFFGETNPDAETSFALDADSNNVFAALELNHGSTYYEELARRGIIGGPSHTIYTEKNLARFTPHIWQYEMALDRIFANLGEWMCGRLAGRDATYTSDPLLSSERRVFALTFMGSSFRNFRGQDIGIGALERELDRCGSALKLTFHGDEQDGSNQSTRSTEMLRMREEEVTTIICMGYPSQCSQRAQAASSQGYYPEWILTNYWWLHSNNNLRLFPRDQLAHTFGVFFDPRLVPPENQPYRWAVDEMNSEAEVPHELQSMLDYRNFLLLASGIQTAGPNLTPETFRRGLHRTTFPNPSHPNMAGAVGFTGGHSMTKDGVEWWWSNTHRPSPNHPVGAICYLDGGSRHAKGSWPTEDGAFFEGPCDSGVA